LAQESILKHTPFTIRPISIFYVYHKDHETREIVYLASPDARNNYPTLTLSNWPRENQDRNYHLGDRLTHRLFETCSFRHIIMAESISFAWNGPLHSKTELLLWLAASLKSRSLWRVGCALCRRKFPEQKLSIGPSGITAFYTTLKKRQYEFPFPSSEMSGCRLALSQTELD